MRMLGKHKIVPFDLRCQAMQDELTTSIKHIAKIHKVNTELENHDVDGTDIVEIKIRIKPTKLDQETEEGKKWK